MKTYFLDLININVKLTLYKHTLRHSTPRSTEFVSYLAHRQRYGYRSLCVCNQDRTRTCSLPYDRLRSPTRPLTKLLVFPRCQYGYFVYNSGLSYSFLSCSQGGIRTHNEQPLKGLGTVPHYAPDYVSPLEITVSRF